MEQIYDFFEEKPLLCDDCGGVATDEHGNTPYVGGAAYCEC
jgi:hypothetical protein